MPSTRRLALIVVLILIAAGAGATPAAAGEYPVYACEPAFGDVNASWEAYSSVAAMPAYVKCTSAAKPWDSGVVTRASMVAGSVPAHAHARMTFRSPRGAVLSRMTYSHRFCGGSSFQAGLMNDAFAWLHASGPGSCGTPVQSPHKIPLGGTPAVHLVTWCVSSSCGLGGTEPEGYAVMRTATVWVADSTTPSLSITGGSASTPGWKSGIVYLALSASDNVGIRSAEIMRSGSLAWQTSISCNYTLIVPCPPFSSNVQIDTRAAADGAQHFVAKAFDTAGNASSQTIVVLADNTPPRPALDLAVVGGSGWRNRNGFELTWRNPSQNGMSPIAGSEVAVCPASNTAQQWTGCAFHRTDAKSGFRFEAPGPGEWVGRVWLRDEAGNASSNTAQAVEFRLDNTSPDVAFRAIDTSDPTRIDVLASDATSGLAAIEIETRRRGTSSWIPLPTQQTSEGFSARLDDEQLPDGTYDIRARASDRAGNEKSTSRESSGASAQRTLPLRITTRLVAGHVRLIGAPGSRDKRRRRVVVVRPKVPYGRTLPIDGRLMMRGGNPVAGAGIEVWERLALPGASLRRIALVTTDPRGRFRFKALRGPRRLLRFRYAGTALLRARTTEVNLRVMSATTIRSSRSRVVNGEDIVLAGRLLSGPLPTSGKLVQLQAYSRGDWITFATPRADARTGKWSHRYRFTSTRGLVRYRFRARIPPEATYPYAVGVSGSVFVKVRGL